MLAALAPLPSHHSSMHHTFRYRVRSGQVRCRCQSLPVPRLLLFFTLTHTHTESHLYDPLFSVQRAEAIFQMNCLTHRPVGRGMCLLLSHVYHRCEWGLTRHACPYAHGRIGLDIRSTISAALKTPAQKILYD